MVPAANSSPVVVRARVDEPLSRWLWLVKWVLLIPHYVVLLFLSIAFLVVSVMALVGILFTGRYPRDLFDFNLGVLRWGWRVAWYGYAGLGTDRYPPFTLGETPDYPATLDIAYPESSPRGRSLVQWWLLAFPHYLLLAAAGSGVTWVIVASGTENAEVSIATGGLVGMLAFFAGVLLLVGRGYPRDLAGLLAGLDRWALRVIAYGALMTTTFPPFRLDQGPEEPPAPGSDPTGAALVPPVAALSGRAAGGAPAPSVGSVVVRVVGVVLLVPGLVLSTLGAVGLLWQAAGDPDGYISSPATTVSTSTAAVTSGPVELEIDDAASAWLPESWQEVRIRVVPTDPDPVFVGVAPRSEVDRWLAGVAHDEVRTMNPDSVTYDRTAGLPNAAPPTEQEFWVASATGQGGQELTWPLSDGQWVIVLAAADGSPGVEADISAAVQSDVLGWVAAGVLVSGLPLLVVGLLLLVLGSTGARPAAAGSRDVPPVDVGTSGPPLLVR